MSIQTIVITPEFAEQLLDANINNRPKNSRRVTYLADAMRRGEWIFNGDTIRLSKSGVLLDGQHRLAAIAESGIPQKSILVTGLDDESFKTIDTGKARTAGDMLSMEGVSDYNAVAAAVYMMLIYKTTGNPVHGNSDKAPTKAQIVEYVRNNKQPEISARAIEIKKLKKLAPSSILAFCHMVFSEDDKDACLRFFESLESGHSYEGSPIIMLRDKLIEERASKKHKLQKGVVIAYMFSAYRSVKHYKECKRLSLPKLQSSWYLL